MFGVGSAKSKPTSFCYGSAFCARAQAQTTQVSIFSNHPKCIVPGCPIYGVPQTKLWLSAQREPGALTLDQYLPKHSTRAPCTKLKPIRSPCLTLEICQTCPSKRQFHVTKNVAALPRHANTHLREDIVKRNVDDRLEDHQ